MMPVIKKLTYCLLLLLVSSLVLDGCKKKEEPEPPVHNNGGTDDVQRFVYASDLNGNFDIWKMVGEERTKLTSDPTSNHWWPRVSTSTNRILYYKSDESQDINNYSAATLCMMDADGSNQIELISEGAYGWQQQGLASWSSNGNEIVMAAVDSTIGTWQIFVTNSSGSDHVRVSLRDDVNYLDPIFSEDGQSIFCSTIPEGVSNSDENYEIVEVVRTTGEEIQLTNNDHRDQHPCLSPDGKTLIYESLIDPDYLMIGKWALVEFDLASGTESTLLENNNINLFPRYARNGIDVYYSQLDIESFSMTIMRYERESGSSTRLLSEPQHCVNVDPY